MMAEQDEVWRNVSQGGVWIRRFDGFGHSKDEQVAGGHTLRITPADRMYQQSEAADDGQDIFKNGTMQPVKIFDGTEDAHEIASNPNTRSEEELQALFGLHWTKFKAEVASMSNPIILGRLEAIASERDATVKQMETIQARMVEVNPSAVQEREPVNIPEQNRAAFEGISA